MCFNKNKITNINITIPSDITEINENAFYDYTNLTSVIIGNSVTSIGNLAFYDCDNLTSVTIGDGVTISVKIGKK